MRERIRRLSERAELVLITILCFGYVILSSVIVLLRRVGRMELSNGRVLYGIAMELAIIAAAGGILHLRGWKLSRVTKPPSWAGVLAGVPLFIAFMLSYWLTAILAASFFPAVARAVPVAFVPTASVPVLLVFIAVNSIYEEFAVTGYLITALERNGAAFAITASTLVRFLYHLYQGPLASLSILPLGLLFGIVYWRTRNLWPLVVAHTISNLLTMLALVRHGA